MGVSLFTEKAENHTEYDRQMFEQYKLYVELADRISQRRTNANSFFITANAALLTVASWFKDDFGRYMYLISAVGILIALFWFFCIRSYGQLNTAKFKVIHKIEEQLPLALFEYEWEALGRGKSFTTYWPLSHIERIVPFVFIGMYIALSVFTCLNI